MLCVRVGVLQDAGRSTSTMTSLALYRGLVGQQLQPLLDNVTTSVNFCFYFCFFLFMSIYHEILDYEEKYWRETQVFNSEFIIPSLASVPCQTGECLPFSQLYRIIISVVILLECVINTNTYIFSVSK